MTKEEIGKLVVDALREHWQDEHPVFPWEYQASEAKAESIAAGLAVYRAALERAAEACEMRKLDADAFLDIARADNDARLLHASTTRFNEASACASAIRAMIAELDA